MGQRVIALIALALVLGLATYWIGGGEEQAAPTSVQPDVAADPPDLEQHSVVLNAPEMSAPPRVSAIEESLSHPASVAERELVLAGISQLADLLDAHKLDRERWIQAGQAISGSLSGPVERLLREQIEVNSFNRFHAIAATELLRLELSSKSIGDSSPLPSAALEHLRFEQLSATTGASALAAARTLVGVGDLVDALQIADDLIWSEDNLIQRKAAWCLEVNDRAGIARYLATNIIAIESDLRVLLLFRVLVAMEERSINRMLDRHSLDLLSQFVTDLDPPSPDQDVLFTIGVACSNFLAVLDPTGSEQSMLGEIGSSENIDRVRDSARRVASNANPASVHELEFRFVAETDPERRTALAEGILSAAKSQSLSPDTQSEALQLVSTLAQESEHSAVRRRAVAALGSTPGRGAVDALMKVLLQDEDPRVRSAAAHALAGLDRELLAHRRSELSAIDDESEMVRRSVEFCLSR